jgi:hypothetical protein
MQKAKEGVNYGGVLGSLKPILGDVIVHPVVYSQIKSGKHSEAINDFFSTVLSYGEFRVIIDGNVPTDRLLVVNSGARVEVMLDGSDPPLPPEEAEAQELKEIEELRRALVEQHDSGVSWGT